MHALVFGYKQTCSEGFYALVDEKPNKLQTDRVAALSGGKIVRVARVGWFWVGWYAGCVRAEGRLLAPPLPDLLPSQEPSLGLSLPSSIWWMWAVSAPPRSGTASANCARLDAFTHLDRLSRLAALHRATALCVCGHATTLDVHQQQGWRPYLPESAHLPHLAQPASTV